MHRGAFCQFTFRWIYYCHSSKSTGNETGKMHLSAVVRQSSASCQTVVRQSYDCLLLGIVTLLDNIIYQLQKNLGPIVLSQKKCPQIVCSRNSLSLGWEALGSNHWENVKLHHFFLEGHFIILFPLFLLKSRKLGKALNTFDLDWLCSATKLTHNIPLIHLRTQNGIWMKFLA